MFTCNAPAARATRSHSRRVGSIGLQESATTLTPACKMSDATRYARRYPSPWTSIEQRSRSACSRVSMRTCAAPTFFASNRERVVFPLPGSPENMYRVGAIIIYRIAGTLPARQRRSARAEKLPSQDAYYLFRHHRGKREKAEGGMQPLRVSLAARPDIRSYRRAPLPGTTSA